MSHEWHAGVLAQSSWHGLETVATMADAEEMIRAGLESGAWPTGVECLPVRTVDGLDVPGCAVVATYQDGTRRAHGVASEAYRPLDPRLWHDLCRAAVAAGAIPAGAFSLRGGAVPVACFGLPGQDGEVRTYLTIADSMDRSSYLDCLSSSIRVVCANTLGFARSEAGSAAVRIRHTGDMTVKVDDLRTAIEAHAKSGQRMSDLYRDARETRLARNDAAALMNKLFPVPTLVSVEEYRAAEDKARTAEGDALSQLRAWLGEHTASQATVTRARNRQHEAAAAMANPVNSEGPTLATLWNAATFVVDRTLAPGGEWIARETKGETSMLDSMLLGSRGARVSQVERVMVGILRPDGETVYVEQDSLEAAEAYASQGRSLLDGML